jgi:isoleucine--tRNA ligase
MGSLVFLSKVVFIIILCSIRILLFSLFPRSHVFISGYHVTEDTGTGIVHTAPAHGLDDFNICKYHNVITIPDVADDTSSSSSIPRVSIPDDIPHYVLKEDVDENGCYYSDVWTDRLHGKDVLTEGNKEVVFYMLSESHLDCYVTRIKSSRLPTNHHSSVSL